jgi:DNA repair exonuclease SbcCD ATPase subunit
LQQRLFGKDQELVKLQNRITGLETENEALRAEAENTKAYAELLQELEALRKQYENEKKRREELGRNNQRLGGRVSHAERNKQKLAEARAALAECQLQLKNLAQDHQRLQHENRLLLAKLEEVQHFLKQPSHESRNHETS